MFLESLLSYDSSWSQIYSRENCSLQDSGQAGLLSGCRLSYLPLKRPENYQWDFQRLSLCFRESLGSRVSPCPTKSERHNDLRVSPTPSSHVCNHRATETFQVKVSLKSQFAQSPSLSPKVWLLLSGTSSGSMHNTTRPHLFHIRTL